MARLRYPPGVAVVRRPCRGIRVFLLYSVYTFILACSGVRLRRQIRPQGYAFIGNVSPRIARSAADIPPVSK